MAADRVRVSSADPYFDLGTFHRPVSTTCSHAQAWFDRGLVWTYAFNHEEAAKCFERAIAHDPDCAIAYWGLAYTRGPNYNKPWEAFDLDERGEIAAQTYRAVEQARENIHGASAVERALVNALKHRYQESRLVDDLSVWNLDYAAAMAAVYASFPGDLDVAALYADALMNLTPWQLWDLETGKPAQGARTEEARQVLEPALRLPGGSEHPGLLHLYIHLMEMSNTPEVAAPWADALRELVPDAGHLNHMPSHIDILCGNYEMAVTANTKATAADRKFVEREGSLNFYTLYRAHDYHFLIYAAMFAGQSKVALQNVDLLEAAVPEQLIRVESPPMADWLESFLSIRMHVLIRFGRWDDILALQSPTDPDLYAVTTAMMWYAKGIAAAVTSRAVEAKLYRENFHEALKRVPDSRTLFNNKCRDILRVAEAMLEGEYLFRQGNTDEAFIHLERAILLEGSLTYDEPWGWMQPARHAYGALSLESGATQRAIEVYAADLGYNTKLPRARTHPNNVWALHGYHECLVRMKRFPEAQSIKRILDPLLTLADVPITSSCFCRRLQQNT
ncbi:hypothetical protein LOZ58_006002 [Ophidiomyces ophidiicola]|nr:hypothetical protein LOZ58_006002 [Ophidiomyces ophidiicola]